MNLDILQYLKDSFDNVANVTFNDEMQFYHVTIDGLRIIRRKDLTQHNLKVFHCEGKGKTVTVWLGDSKREAI